MNHDHNDLVETEDYHSKSKSSTWETQFQSTVETEGDKDGSPRSSKASSLSGSPRAAGVSNTINCPTKPAENISSGSGCIEVRNGGVDMDSEDDGDGPDVLDQCQQKQQLLRQILSSETQCDLNSPSKGML